MAAPGKSEARSKFRIRGTRSNLRVLLLSRSRRTCFPIRLGEEYNPRTMKTRTFRLIAVALLALFFAQSSFATCGGGGGGGGGGMANSGGGGGSNAPVYVVPWKPAAAPPARGLVLYWFPASQKEIENSSLRQSRTLSLYASQCVAMQVADTKFPTAGKLIGESTLPVAVLASSDGAPINKVENTGGKLKVADVEKLV